MNIKVYSNKSGRSKTLKTNNYAIIEKIAYKFNRWEYLK
jgi:hypothetical protein